MIKKAKQIKRKDIRLYHLSVSNQDNKVFHPRLPNSGYHDEDNTYRRVCFSTTMSGAYRALSFDRYNQDVMYVHVPVNLENIIERGGLYKPSEDLVPDTYFTNEYWCRRPVRLKCIGKAKFTYEEKMRLNVWRGSVRIEWIEKY